MPLHSKKIAKEKNIFINELFKSLPNKNKCIQGDLKERARTFHRLYIPLYILNTYKDKKRISTDFFHIIMSQAIESESSLILGFRTLGMTSLRSLVESDFKFLYYENHPIEYYLHKNGKFNLPISEYRNFLYIYPNSEKIEDLKRDYIESIWTELCGYVHSSLKSITPMTFVEDIDTIFSLSEHKWQKTIKLIKKAIRISVIISFMVNNDWGKPIEKAYFDEIFRLFTAQESNKIKSAFNIT